MRASDYRRKARVSHYPIFLDSFNRHRVESMATGLRPKQMCGVNIAMTMTVVRCPYCVSDDEFRQMIARSDGRFICNRCGHSAIPE